MIEKLPLDVSIIERRNTSLASISFSNYNRESSAKHRVYFGSELSDVEVPKFDPSQLSSISLTVPEQTFSKAMQRAQTHPAQKLELDM